MLDVLANMSYADLKRDLGIAGDFCIYIENDEGRIVPIGNKTSFGKPDINVSGMPCGSTVAVG